VTGAGTGRPALARWTAAVPAVAAMLARATVAAAMVAAAALLAGCGEDEVDVPVALPTVAPTVTAAPTVPAATTAGPAPARGVPRPRIVQWRIPYGARRRAQMAAYSRRHYGDAEWRLDPRAIVQHWTQIDTVRDTRRLFARNRRDAELGELPGTCSHFAIDRDGTIFQLVDERVRCRHAFGVNHVSLGIEHIGFSDREVMGNRRQLRASLALTRWLACRHGIAPGEVIGHAETVRSSWYTELRPERHSRSTHSDFGRPAMRRYRARLAALGCD